MRPFVVEKDDLNFELDEFTLRRCRRQSAATPEITGFQP